MNGSKPKLKELLMDNIIFIKFKIVWSKDTETRNLAKSIGEKFNSVFPTNYNILIDITKAKYITSSFIGMLAYISKTIDDNGGIVVVLNCERKSEILRMLSLCEVETAKNIYIADNTEEFKIKETILITHT